MYCKEIIFEDYAGNERNEKHYFHLTKAEFLKFLVTNGEYTIDQQLKWLSEKSRGKDVINILENLVDISYGQKSLDGRKFEKSPEILADFKGTEGYSEFFFSLVTDADEAAKFVAGILPAKLMDEVKAEMEKDDTDIPEELKEAINNA